MIQCKDICNHDWWRLYISLVTVMEINRTREKALFRGRHHEPLSVVRNQFLPFLWIKWSFFPRTVTSWFKQSSWTYHSVNGNFPMTISQFDKHWCSIVLVDCTPALVYMLAWIRQAIIWCILTHICHVNPRTRIHSVVALCTTIWKYRTIPSLPNPSRHRRLPHPPVL